MTFMPGADLTRRVIGCAIDVHRALGPGLLEGVYETCLCEELVASGLAFARQRSVPVTYKGRMLGHTYRMDIVVADILVLEIKAGYQVLPIHEAQLRTYLRLSGLCLGLVMNFNTVRIRDGIRRVIGPDAPWDETPVLTEA